MSNSNKNEDNVSLLKRLGEELWNKGRPEIIDKVIHLEAVLHFPTGDLFGPDGLRQHYEANQNSFSNFSFSINETISDGDRIAVRWSVQMKHINEFEGIKATGREVGMTGMTFFHMQKGQIIEAWDEWNLISMLNQLGAMPGNSDSKEDLTLEDQSK